MTVLISYTLPCHSREGDLCAALPSVIAAANQSPPVQIVVVDYGVKDTPLGTLLDPLRHTLIGGWIEVPVYRGTPHFRMAHARNIGIRACRGDYVVISSADILLAPEYFAVVRQRISDTGAVWMAGDQPGRHLLAIRRDELTAAGGFDERFEMYGPEDKDLDERLTRRGALFAEYPCMVSHIHTPRHKKCEGYGSDLSARDMYRRSWLVYHENVSRNALTANDGIAWGQA